MKKIALIGSCGSIGKQVLNVVRRHSEEFEICALVSGSRSAEFEAQLSEFKPKYFAAYSQNPQYATELAALNDADIIFNAASGFAGLEYSLCAIRAGKRLALANKETLVCGGEWIMGECKAHGAEIAPVDSEHSAIWQCLNFDCKKTLSRLIITASGGAFRGRKWRELGGVTPQEALCHPTWKMGKKITIDSATLLNKGYEVIEAHILYETPYENIVAVIQPQSIIHSLVEFEDGAVLAQMSYPTMELPIQLALTYPKRLDCGLKRMDFSAPFALQFEPLERENYPLFSLALDCGKAGGLAPCYLNAADEVAVAAFLKGGIKFTDIFTVSDGVLQSLQSGKVCSSESLKTADGLARKRAREIIDGLKG